MAPSLSGEWGGPAWALQRAGERASINATTLPTLGGPGGDEWLTGRRGVADAPRW